MEHRFTANDKQSLTMLAIRLLIIFQNTQIIHLGKKTNRRDKDSEIRKTVTNTQKREIHSQVLMIVMGSNQLDSQPDKRVHRYSHCTSNPLQVTEMKTLGSQVRLYKVKSFKGTTAFPKLSQNCFAILSFVSASFCLSRYNFLFVCLGCCHLVQWKL